MTDYSCSAGSQTLLRSGTDASCNQSSFIILRLYLAFSTFCGRLQPGQLPDVVTDDTETPLERHCRPHASAAGGLREFERQRIATNEGRLELTRRLGSRAPDATIVGADGDLRVQATLLDIRYAHLNQPVKVASIRPAFAGFLGLTGGRPDLVGRFGRGPLMPRSLRRPIDTVLV